jgi:hypothetical protein
MISHLHKRVGAIILLTTLALAQLQAQRSGDVYVDRKGTMRWRDGREEVKGFGVNYTAPFAHAYRTARRLGVPLREAIDGDIYHFARLGFDGYRVHVWDTEISDTVGNLLENEHLDLFDYMLAKMKERGIHCILTPIAYWGNGWPEPDEDTPGFSRKYGKDACLANEGAIKAQENYLYQFLSHVNPYTGTAYKDDPAIIAFEVSNEPHHREAPEKVTRFINRMVRAMRRTGCRKPIFYNVSHSIHLVEAYFDADIQGGTFQWYPTGLGFGRELRGNVLPNVDAYRIPFAGLREFQRAAKIVYEFDAADIGRSYIYPAMARSFRTAGIQWATHFAYDPTYMAPYNTEYNTHFMNLVYAPQKALSLKLASEVFHNIPMYAGFGQYPANTRFGPFHVSYQDDLAEMITDTRLIYTNNTMSTVPSPGSLVEIAGFGDSEVVQYDGKGAYFLDRLQPGVWRLEVMPDAIWVHDPFGRNGLDRINAVVKWAEWNMTIDLPDLGEDFSIEPINEGNEHSPTVSGKTFAIRPGTYLVTKQNVTTQWNGDSRWKNITLKEFYAPQDDVDKTWVVHTPPTGHTEGKPLELAATVVSKEGPVTVEVVVAGPGRRPQRYTMACDDGYIYKAVIPPDEVREGFLRYYIIATAGGVTVTYPGAIDGVPFRWDFPAADPYEVRIVRAGAPVYLFVASRDHARLYRQFTRMNRLMPLADPERAELRIHVDELSRVDPENPNGERFNDYSMRFYFGDYVSGRREDVSKARSLIFRGRHVGEGDLPIQVALITRDGRAFGGIVTLTPSSQDYTLAIEDLKPVDIVLLPRPYPTFLPYYFKPNQPGTLDMSEVETLQISIGPGLKAGPDGPIELGIESLRLEP